MNLNAYNMNKFSPIHPFPARMASDIALERLKELEPDSLILDPMTGSGTVLRMASEMGHRGAGFDLDPLAVLMTRVWTTPLDSDELIRLGDLVVKTAESISEPRLDWIDGCQETRAFIEFWFENRQIAPLRRLSFVLKGICAPYGDALRLALSRIIITKERGASVARDTSHSRPHRTFFGNDYDVMRGYKSSVRRLADRLASDRLKGAVVANVGDARNMSIVPHNAVDAIITSPPYLNAIDYLRGHKLALVWLGANIPEIRLLRSISIGAERKPGGNVCEMCDEVLGHFKSLKKLPKREIGIVTGYVNDLIRLYSEFDRVLKRSGKIVAVVGDSCLKGVPIPNARLNALVATALGFKTGRNWQRKIPARNRYLPTPEKDGVTLAKRMTSESVMEFFAAS